MRNYQKLTALLALFSALYCLPATAKSIDASCRSFPLWEAFQQKYIQQDGRVWFRLKSISRFYAMY